MSNIRIEELNIGDWVYVQFPDGDKLSGRIVSSSNTGSMEVLCSDTKVVRCTIHFICPIPITAEVLEKNGFVKESNVDHERFEWRENGGVAITLNRDSFSKSETFVICTFKIGINIWVLKIEHVHQLQHAIRLAGIDKEIEV